MPFATFNCQLNTLQRFPYFRADGKKKKKKKKKKDRLM
jgi:hypothetical protein